MTNNLLATCFLTFCCDPYSLFKFKIYFFIIVFFWLYSEILCNYYVKTLLIYIKVSQILYFIKYPQQYIMVISYYNYSGIMCSCQLPGTWLLIMNVLYLYTLPFTQYSMNYHKKPHTYSYISSQYTHTVLASRWSPTTQSKRCSSEVNTNLLWEWLGIYVGFISWCG